MDASIGLIVSKIEELIIATGGKIQAFYPYVLRQQYIYGFLQLGIWLLSILAIVYGLITSTKHYWDNSDKSNIGELFLIWGGIIFIITLIFLITDGLGRLLNPHYFAVQDLIELGSKLIK